jgi:protein TonB
MVWVSISGFTSTTLCAATYASVDGIGRLGGDGFADPAGASGRDLFDCSFVGNRRRRERATWQKELAAHLNKYKRYPQDRAQRDAAVIVGFVLDRVGHVISKHIVKGSGDASFDAAALDMLQRSDPVPPPPALVADEGLSFRLPVIFQVKHANSMK